MSSQPNCLRCDFLLESALRWQQQGCKVCMITLIEIRGSSPRPLGAQMVVCDRGDGVGLLSGGCIEEDVVLRACEFLKRGVPSMIFTYGNDPSPFALELPCGSVLSFFFEDVSDALWIEEALLQLKKRKVFEHLLPIGLKKKYRPALRTLLLGKKDLVEELHALSIFMNYESLMLRVGVELSTPWAFEAPAVDEYSAVIVALHQHKRWELAILKQMLPSQAFYFGMLGSQKTHEQRLKLLEEEGLKGREQILSPMGIFGGTKSPKEIALSSMAQVVQYAQKL